MSDDRLAQVRAEAWQRYPEEWDPYNEEAVDDWGYSSGQRLAFQRGVEWADANQHSTPEDLVTAYEEGQRDAVEKGLARARVTSAQLHHVAWMLQNLPEDKIAEMLPGLLGIEVRDE